MEGDNAYCHQCERVTRWLPVRRGRRIRCEGCGDTFPCGARRCGHLDCNDARRERRAERTDR